ncbi:MAG: hypothetical protein IJO03_04045 [Clostridia bacterium]|nr:hypothetical protein [Clostridia bacterium]
MNELKFLISGIISVAFVAVSAAYLIKNTRSTKKENRRISPFNVFIAGVFMAVFFVFVPIYFKDYSGEGSPVIPVLLSFHNSMRVFILDGEFDIVRNAVADCCKELKFWFSIWSAGLYVLAPVLTAGFVLSMFKSAKAQAKYSAARKRPTFIFSKLNEKSLALAKSIYDDEKIKNPVLVFAEVYDKTLEEHYEWVSKAKEIGAILMPKDIDDISIDNKKGRVELFYISDDESENITQAVKFVTGHYKKKTKKIKDENGEEKKVPVNYNERKNTKVFVFAANEGNSRIVDSLDKGDHYKDIAEERFESDAFIDDSELFKVRRVDDIRSFAWDCIEKADIFDKYVQVGDEKVVSVLILGMGRYGTELLKTLAWYGQMKGYRLEINVVDKNANGASASSKFGHICPEIMATNNKKVEGDSFYSIEFFEGVDVFADSWDNAVCYDGDDTGERLRAERLRRTTLAFVALGDDDKNIQAAVELRTLFDRVNKTVATASQPENELPAIYSIVYDEQKTENLAGAGSQGTAGMLRTHKKQPYNIQFIGSLSSQYDYSSVYPEELEKEAFDKCHMQWSYYSVDREIETKEQEEGRKLTADEKEGMRAAARKEQIGFYENFEYFRLSSMSKAMHKRLIRKRFDSEFGCEHGGGYECDCDKCWARRANEHNRWNAYTRSIGYVYSNKKSDRAKTHTDLIPFDELSDATKRLD